MLRATFATTANGMKYGKFAFAVLIAIAFCAAHPASTAYAKKKRATYGTIKIRTTPGGFPLEIDGKPEGATATEYTEFKLDPGLHTVVISLPSGQRWSREVNVVAGRRKCVELSYKPVTITPPKSPCPYPVILSGPASVTEGDVITFTAAVNYSGTSTLNYNWTVSPSDAKIIGGADKPTLTVDSTGLGGRQVTATLVVDDGSGEAACRQTAQASTSVPHLPPPPTTPSREFDVCCSCSYDDQKARLDNLAIELTNDPSTTTYVIAYGGRTSRAGQADRLLARAKEYLMQKRGVDQARIVALNGGFREEDCVELWVVPRGAQPPQATPTVQAGDVRPAPEKAPKKKGRRD
jgi:hypothetical protein